MAVWSCALVVAGCSGGGGDGATTSPPPTTAPTAGTGPAAGGLFAGGGAGTGRGATVELDHSGWKVVVSPPAYAGDRATAIASFTNTTSKASPFRVSHVLESAGSTYKPVVGEESLPASVAPGATEDGTFVFAIDTSFNQADARLVYGATGTRQAIVSLCGGETTHLRPEAVPVSSTATAGTLTAGLSSAQLRADKPGTGEMRPPDQLTLSVVVSLSNPRAAEVVLTPSSFVLSGPTGGPEPAESISATSIPGGGKADVTVVFVVADPPSGSYALAVTGADGAANLPLSIV